MDSNGKFRLSARLETDGYYILNYGRNTAYIYLYPKDDLLINFNATYFENSLTFEGRGSERNNYLAKKSIVGSQLTKNLESFYQKDESKYLENIGNVESTHQALGDIKSIRESFIGFQEWLYKKEVG